MVRVTLDAVGPYRNYRRQVDEINGSSSIEEAAGGVYARNGKSVGGSKFVSRPGRECNIGRLFREFERF